MSELHIKYGGNSRTFDLDVLDLGDLSTEQDIRIVVARELDTMPDRLLDYQIERTPQGNIIMRPQASFGW